MFLSILRSSLVCDTFIPLWFLENGSTRGVLVFNRFLEIFGYDGDKLLLNPFFPNATFLYPLKTCWCWCFQGAEKGCKEKEFYPWHVSLLKITFCKFSIIVSFRFLSAFIYYIMQYMFIYCINLRTPFLFSYFVYFCKNFLFDMWKTSCRGFTIDEITSFSKATPIFFSLVIYPISRWVMYVIKQYS